MGERAIPILPCRDLDDMVPFYEALGFTVTYRQARPNPYLCVQRGGLDLHFFGVAAVDPESSMGSAILQVADAGALFDEFAAGLRAWLGRLPLTGIPRITRPRRMQGTAGGFTVVDPGGNWLRVVAGADAPPAPLSGSAPEARLPAAAEATDEEQESASGEQDGAPGSSGAVARLDRVLLNAARQGDAHGDVRTAISVLETGLARYEVSDVERIPALAYLAELRIRDDDPDAARAVIATVDALVLNTSDRERVAADLRALDELRTALAE
jgi:catechol 2,3-dioxygenase-like lactoylglutathione lyase family enzyme